MRVIKKIVAMTLVISMILTAQQGVFIVLAEETAKAIESADKIDLPNYIPNDSEKRSQHIEQRVDLENEYMSVYENEDGSLTVYSFQEPIKYTDKDDRLIDYDNRLKKINDVDKKASGYAYEISSSNVDIMLPEDIVTDKAIKIEYDKYKIEFKPITDISKDKDNKKIEEFKLDSRYEAKEIKNSKDKDKYDTVEYLSADSDNIQYKYSAANTGVKEDIILLKKPETNVFQFEYKVKGLVLKKADDGSILFLDKESDTLVGIIEPMFMYDSCEKGIHYSEKIQIDIQNDKENKNNGKYIITITVDKCFLDSEETIYPVVIDPTTTIQFPYGNSITDTFVASGKPNAYWYYYFGYIRAGRSSAYATTRAYIKPIIPSNSALDSYDIVDAKYEVYCNDSETSSGNPDEYTYIDIHRVTSDWSYDVTWNTKPGYDGEIQATVPVKDMQWYTFNITNMVQNWAKNTANSTIGYPNYGFVLKDKTEGPGVFRSFGSSENINGKKACLTIEYEPTDEEAPNNITSLTAEVTPDAVNQEKAVITVEWDETTDNPSWRNSGVKEYELTLTDTAGNFYDSSGNMTSSATSATVPHTAGGSPYSYTFSNLPDSTTYECKIRACDNATTANWSGYTYTGAIVVADIVPVTLSIGTSNWVDDTTPTITWTGIAGTDNVYYTLDDGDTWSDSQLDGSTGSGDLPAFTSDGEYQIKIKGQDDQGNSGFISNTVIYKLDSAAPTTTISSPDGSAALTGAIDIVGQVTDESSGIDTWTLEYGSSSTPTQWNQITSGFGAISQGATIATWDTSSLSDGDYTIRLTSTDNVGLTSSTTVTIDIDSPTILTAPYNVSAALGTNYTVELEWDDEYNDPSTTTYNVYRGTSQAFLDDLTPNDSNKIAQGVTNTYYEDQGIALGATYYYKVVAVSGNDISGAATSNGVTIYEKMLGLQDFWKFSRFSAGNGAGYINVANGNLVFNSTDLVYPGYMLAMVMRRTYNSQSDTLSPLGYGWDFSYNTCLYEETDGDLILKDGDGSIHKFETNGDGTYDAPAGIFMDLTHNSTDGYIIERKDYVKYYFNDDLQLVKLAEQNGNYIKFNYDASDKLESVENYPKGADEINDTPCAEVEFVYYKSTDYNVDPAHVGLLKFVTDESGRTFRYEYAAGDKYLKKAYLTQSVSGEYYKEEYTYEQNQLGEYKLKTIKDANGHITTMEYEGAGKVSKVTYPDQKYFELDYTATASTIGLFDTTKSVFVFTTTITDSWNHSTKYYYEANHGLVRIIENTLGEETEFDYNSNLQVTKVRYKNYVGSATTPSVIETKIEYYEDDNSNIDYIEDALGHRTSFTYDSVFKNKVKTVTVQQNATTNAVTTYDYNQTTGKLEKTTDALGNATTYTYDTAGTGLIDTVTNYVGNTSSSVSTATDYTYVDGWVTAIEQSGTNVSTTITSSIAEYDDYGNPIVTQDAMGNYSKVLYDALGRPYKSYLPDQTGTSEQDWTDNEYTTATYDIKGNVKSTTDIKGIVTSYSYDSMDRLTRTVVNGNLISYIDYLTYTHNGKTCLKVKYTDPKGRKTYEKYDELGRVIETGVLDGNTEKFKSIMTYDMAGNVRTTKDLIVNSNEYRKVVYQYDKLSRNVKTVLYKGSASYSRTLTAYDYVGNVTSVTDQKNYVTFYEYDKLGRMTKVKQDDDDVLDYDLVTQYQYDAIIAYGNEDHVVNKIIDAKGHVKMTYLDAFGHAVLEIDKGDTSNSTQMYVKRAFNNDGTVYSINQAAPNATDGATRQTDYYTYNNWGQLTTIKYGSTTSTDNQTVYSYNDHGQMHTMTDRKVNPLDSSQIDELTTSWTYDALGRISSTTQDGLTVSYEFNDANQLTKLIQPKEINGTGTTTTRYIYDEELGYLNTIQQDGKIVRHYNYDAAGQVILERNYPDFVSGDYDEKLFSRYTYNAIGQLTQIKYTDASDANYVPANEVILEQYDYAYDLRGNIETETMSTYYDCEDGTVSQTREYDYDSLNRIETMDIAGYETEYEYDNAGNKTKETVQIGNSEFRIYTNTYNEFDQLTQVDLASSNGTQTIGEYYYDDRGSQRQAVTDNYAYSYQSGYELIPVIDPNTGEPFIIPGTNQISYVIGDPIYTTNGTPELETNYTYDKAGYMSKTVNETAEKDANGNYLTTTTTHFYNGMEQRVSKTRDQIETKYFYSGTSLLFTADENNAKMSENIITLGGQTIASKSYTGNYADEFYFYNQDIRNSTTGIIGLDSSDNFELMKGYTYDIYGKATAIGNEDFINDITFTGAIAEGGDIYYMHARFYDANTQRFLSQDTYKGNAWEPMSQNLYSYVGNNPVNYVDPTGHYPTGVPSDIYYGQSEYFEPDWSNLDSPNTKLALLNEIYRSSTDDTVKEEMQRAINYGLENGFDDIVISSLQTKSVPTKEVADPLYRSDYAEEIKKSGTKSTITGVIVGLLLTPVNPYVGIVAGVAISEAGKNNAVNELNSQTGTNMTGEYLEFSMSISGTETTLYSTSHGTYGSVRVRNMTISGRVGVGNQDSNTLVKINFTDYSQCYGYKSPLK